MADIDADTSLMQQRTCLFIFRSVVAVLYVCSLPPRWVTLWVTVNKILIQDLSLGSWLYF